MQTPLNLSGVKGRKAKFCPVRSIRQPDTIDPVRRGRQASTFVPVRNRRQAGTIDLVMGMI